MTAAMRGRTGPFERPLRRADVAGFGMPPRGDAVSLDRVRMLLYPEPQKLFVSGPPRL